MKKIHSLGSEKMNLTKFDIEMDRICKCSMDFNIYCIIPRSRAGRRSIVVYDGRKLFTDNRSVDSIYANIKPITAREPLLTHKYANLGIIEINVWCVVIIAILTGLGAVGAAASAWRPRQPPPPHLSLLISR